EAGPETLERSAAQQECERRSRRDHESGEGEERGAPRIHPASTEAAAEEVTAGQSDQTHDCVCGRRPPENLAIERLKTPREGREESAHVGRSKGRARRCDAQHRRWTDATWPGVRPQQRCDSRALRRAARGWRAAES